eukprot:7296673-Prorocentrum_lima.AAC.1
MSPPVVESKAPVTGAAPRGAQGQGNPSEQQATYGKVEAEDPMKEEASDASKAFAEARVKALDEASE